MYRTPSKPTWVTCAQLWPSLKQNPNKISVTFGRQALKAGTQILSRGVAPDYDCSRALSKTQTPIERVQTLAIRRLGQGDRRPIRTREGASSPSPLVQGDV